MKACEFLFETLAIHGGTQYGLEQVSQLEHALQCAALAESEGAPPSLIVASLLHDIGHLVHGYERDVEKRGFDDLHEVKGAALLGRWFGAEVSEPVRLHVKAKRYLCGMDDNYRERLSLASKRSLELQGDALDRLGSERFIAQPWAEEAICLRRWDDLAKIPDRDVPRLDHYRHYVERLLLDQDPGLRGISSLAS